MCVRVAVGVRVGVGAGSGGGEDRMGLSGVSVPFKR